MEGGGHPYILICILLFIILVLVCTLIIVYLKSRQEKVTEEDIISLVNEGHEDGNILASEAAMIQNIFEFNDKDAKDIMVHRKNIVAIDGDWTLETAVAFINQNNFSRYPVFLEDLDNIIGILHIKDILSILDKDHMSIPIKDLKNCLGSVESVTETHSINALFAKMQSKKKHMVIVIDEYGQVSGLLSMEDILEEIVGNIEDEHDEKEILIEKNIDNSFIMDGTTSLDDVGETLGVKLSDDFETLNGYLIFLLGRIPDDGSKFELEDDNFKYEIKNVTSKVIDEVVIRPKTAPVVTNDIS